MFKKLPRSVWQLLLCLVILLSMSTVAWANGPSPYEVYTLELVDIKDHYPGAVYVDLLIPLPTTHSQYTDSNPVPENFPKDAEIISWRDGDYCSYTFHYRDAVSQIKLDHNEVTFFGHTEHAQQILELVGC